MQGVLGRFRPHRWVLLLLGVVLLLLPAFPAAQERTDPRPASETGVGRGPGTAGRSSSSGSGTSGVETARRGDASPPTAPPAGKPSRPIPAASPRPPESAPAAIPAGDNRPSNPTSPQSAEPHEAAGTDHATLLNQLLLGLVVILIGAKLGAELFERMGQPAVLGEILVGILLGNLGLAGIHGLDFLKTAEGLSNLAELGVILLLFEVGLESNIGEMRRVGLSSLMVATLGVVAPLALGFFTSRFFLPGEPDLVHLFVGATLCATSVGITARVLKDLGQLQRPESRIILGAAVLDDVMGLVVLAVVGGLIKATVGGGTLSPWEVVAIVGKATGFLVGAVVLGKVFSPWLFRCAAFLHVQHMLLVTSLGFCFLLASLAGQIGLAPIVGAFAAGLILDPVHYQPFQERDPRTIEELIHPISGFLVPVFFVVTGAHVDLSALGDTSVLGFAAALVVVAALGKQVCAFGVLERGLNRIAVGIGMIPRGEVGLIFANIGLTLRLPGENGVLEPVVSPATFSAVVLVVLVTTLVTPPLLKLSLAARRPDEARSTP